jgi:hypothetical protein
MAQHEVGCGLADFGAVDHQAKMFGLGMRALFLQAMGQCCAQTDRVAALTIFNTCLHAHIHFASPLCLFAVYLRHGTR